jgi:hypothetical protein
MIIYSDSKNLSYRIKKNHFQSQNYFTRELGTESGKSGASALPIETLGSV